MNLADLGLSDNVGCYQPGFAGKCGKTLIGGAGKYLNRYPDGFKTGIE